jgi:hypothetical protein
MMNAIYSDSYTYLKSIYQINHNHATWMRLDVELSQGREQFTRLQCCQEIPLPHK